MSWKQNIEAANDMPDADEGLGAKGLDAAAFIEGWDGLVERWGKTFDPGQAKQIGTVTVEKITQWHESLHKTLDERAQEATHPERGEISVPGVSGGSATCVARFESDRKENCFIPRCCR